MLGNQKKFKNASRCNLEYGGYLEFKETGIHNRSIQYTYKEIQYQSYTHSTVFYHNISEE